MWYRFTIASEEEVYVALYAFDGTWNLDKEGTEHDTNVVWFRDSYNDGVVNYWPGVGTRLGVFGKAVGGITGAGGRKRISEAIAAARQNFKNGDTVVDVVGFSRGSALALHFANTLQQGIAGHEGVPSVRFLGLWDTVPSFGVPGNPIDLGWELHLPDNAEHCYHAMALDERRYNFPLHRLEEHQEDTSNPPRLTEVWFRGVHSDVGGGNDNPGLSSIALAWMFDAATRAGVKFKVPNLTANGARRKPGSPISIHRFDSILHFRTVRSSDWIHESVKFQKGDKDRQYNNPPNGAALVNDAGGGVGTFLRA